MRKRMWERGCGHMRITHVPTPTLSHAFVLAMYVCVWSLLCTRCESSSSMSSSLTALLTSCVCARACAPVYVRVRASRHTHPRSIGSLYPCAFVRARAHVCMWACARLDIHIRWVSVLCNLVRLCAYLCMCVCARLDIPIRWVSVICNLVRLCTRTYTGARVRASRHIHPMSIGSLQPRAFVRARVRNCVCACARV